jgi:hypothetical protein
MTITIVWTVVPELADAATCAAAELELVPLDEQAAATTAQTLITPAKAIRRFIIFTPVVLSSAHRHCDRRAPFCGLLFRPPSQRQA